MSQRVQQSCVLVLDVCYLCTSFSVFIIMYVCCCCVFFFFFCIYVLLCISFFFLGKGLILLFCIFSCNSCPFLSRLIFFVVYLWCICLVIIVNKLEVWWQYLPPTLISITNYNEWGGGGVPGKGSTGKRYDLYNAC